MKGTQNNSIGCFSFFSVFLSVSPTIEQTKLHPPTLGRRTRGDSSSYTIGLSLEPHTFSYCLICHLDCDLDFLHQAESNCQPSIWFHSKHQYGLELCVYIVYRVIKFVLKHNFVTKSPSIVVLFFFLFLQHQKEIGKKIQN